MNLCRIVVVVADANSVFVDEDEDNYCRSSHGAVLNQEVVRT